MTRTHCHTTWAAATGLAAGLLIGLHTGPRPLSQTATATVTVRDTVVVHDTLRPEPKVVKQYVTRVVHDTVRIHTSLTDSTAVAALPFTRRVYADSSYRAVVSGYRPSLDSLELLMPLRTVTERTTVTQRRTTRNRPRFSLGLQVGYGTDFSRHGPYVGIGVQWNVLCW